MVDFNKSKWTILAKNLGPTDPNLKYAKGGGLATALMKGLGAYGAVRGGLEDEASRAEAIKEQKAGMAEQLSYDRGQDQFTNQLATDKFGYQQGQDLISNKLLADKFGYSQKSDVLDRSMKEKVAEIGATGTAQTGLGGVYKDGQFSSDFIEQSEKQQGKNFAADIDAMKTVEANLPSLYETVDSLKAFSEDATFTGAGVAKDFLARQVGESTQGGVAREGYKQTVANELLPKLKETFGGQLSDSERESLLSTLGDVNKTPEEKQVTLEAFIKAKERQVRANAQKAGMTPVDINNPQVKEAIAAGYSMEEIRQHMGG